MTFASALPALALLPSALAFVLILLFSRRPAIRETWSVLATIAQTAVVAAMLPSVLSGSMPVWRALSLVPGIPLELRGDAFGVFFALLASALWVVTTVYSIGYTRAERERAQTRYFASFALSLFATVGIALAGNLLTFFVFYEMLTVAAYPLVIHRGTTEAARAGRIYLVYTFAAGTALLAAVVWTAALVGHVDFVAGGTLGGDASTASLCALFALFVVGCGVKAAIVPLHTWLPIAMVAPTPVSALLHAVAVVKAGVFGIVRVTGFVFGPALLHDLGAGAALAALAGATIVLASLAALGQDNLKRLLAFSTVGQLSYVVLGAALGGAEALSGGVMHMASHALLKITLFFCAGAVAATTHVERVSQLTGIGRRMPLTMGAFAVCAFLLAGFPPGPAFVSKWRLLTGASDQRAWGAVAVLLASAVLNVAYFGPVVVRAFARQDARSEPRHPRAAGTEPAAGPRRAAPEAPLTMLLPLLATAAAGVALGFDPDAGAHLLSLARATAIAITAAR